MRKLSALFLALLPGMLFAQDAKGPKFVPALGWDRATQGAFVTSVVADAQSAVWAGTEGNGLWRYDPRAKKWTQFTIRDGLGDDCVYALAVDKLGRIWAGHLNHGVSVWNGEKWKNYGLLDGPLGDRVFAIATCPTDGDVWIATDCGVARYSLEKDDWDYFTRASGLPSDQIQSIAFDTIGNIYLGTQCDGIVMADARDKYKKWIPAKGPATMPLLSTGTGLSSALINSITVVLPPQNVVRPGETERLIATTPLGISVSMDKGDHFNFLRGEDWQANINGLAAEPEGAVPAAPQPGMAPGFARPVFIQGGGGGQIIIQGGGRLIVNGNGGNVVFNGNGGNVVMPQGALPMEDWVTCMRQEKETGLLWTGYRQKGLEIRNFGTSTRVDPEGAESLTVRSIWLSAKAPPLIAIYDEQKGGLATLDSYASKLEPGDAPPKTPPPLPAPAKAPTADSVEPVIKQIEGFKNEFLAGEAAYLGDDWRTGGDWVGHYGKSYAMLCGFGKEGIFASEQGFKVEAGIGPHHKEGEAAEISSILNKETDNARALYDPLLGHRIFGEISDGSQALDRYPLAWDGPDLQLTVTVPAGLHCLSLYFCNDQAHTGALNKLRDYQVQVLAGGKGSETIPKGTLLAQARATDFWGGVYKQFAVRGPAQYVVRVARNRSYGTSVQGVFLDSITEDTDDEGNSLAKRKALPGFEKAPYEMPAAPEENANAGPGYQAALKLWAQLDDAFDKRAPMALQNSLRIWAYRTAAAAKAPEALLANWRWQMTIWAPEDRAAFQKAMESAFKAYATQNPSANQVEKSSK